jgi:predicted RNase H-like nuclease
MDLAWGDRNPSGLAALRFDDRRRRFVLFDHACLTSDDEIIAWVKSHSTRTAVLGIDAPIIAPNPPGVGRPCDGKVTSVFGKFHAGTYPANRVKCARPVRLRRKLERLGFDPDPSFRARSSGRRQIEVFPHPAQVVLFNLPRILKYKKGRLAERKRGLARLAGHIARDLPRLGPGLSANAALKELLNAVLTARGGVMLKAMEDRLDAVVCAYVAAYYWFWGTRRCRVFGDVRRGYIVVPDKGVIDRADR